MRSAWKCARSAASIALAASVALASVAGCARKKAQGPPPAAPVAVAEAVSMDVPVILSAIGTGEAFNTVAVTARVGGEILKVGFTEGQDVPKGALLFQIDPAPYRTALDQAIGNLERDRAQMANADAEAARYADLVKKDFVTKEQYDSFVSAAAAAKATVAADEALAQRARLDLEYCTIRAPMAGRTGNLLVQEGNLVTANAANPLVTINQIVPLNVRFTVPEQRLDDVRRYARGADLEVRAFPPSDSANVRSGKLFFIDNTVDEQTGTVLLKATFQNGDRAFWPGQFVRVDLILTKQPNATVVPAAAVQASQQGDYVYVVAPGDTVQMRPVIQGVRLDDRVVIEKGVAPGERVVTDGQLLLVPGAKVAVKSGPGAAPQGGASGAAGGARVAGADSARSGKAGKPR